MLLLCHKQNAQIKQTNERSAKTRRIIAKGNVNVRSLTNGMGAKQLNNRTVSRTHNIEVFKISNGQTDRLKKVKKSMHTHKTEHFCPGTIDRRIDEQARKASKQQKESKEHFLGRGGLSLWRVSE